MTEQTNLNLEGMDLDGLRRFRRHVDNAIAEYDGRRRREALAAAEAAAQQHGFKLNDLTGGRVTARSKSGTRTARYANPEDSSQTWSGRGRRPGWIVAALAAGGTLEEFEIART